MTDVALKLWRDDRGQDIAEYAVMLAVILVLVVGTIRLVGSNANNAFSTVASTIQYAVLRDLRKQQGGNMSEMRVELSCKSGNVFSIFVREAAEHKGEITCPACGQAHEYSLADIRKLAA